MCNMANVRKGAVARLQEPARRRVVRYFQKRASLFIPSTTEASAVLMLGPSARAFIIITTIASAVAAWFALLEVFKYKTTKWRVVFCLMTFISGVISWAICLSLFTTKQCDLFGTSLEEFQDAKLGDNFPACFVAWLFTTCAIALEFVNQSIYRCCDKDSSSSTSGSKDHHHQDYSRRHHSRDRRRHHRGGSRRSNSRR